MTKVTYGPRAREAMRERAIEPAWVERSIRTPNHTEQDPRHADRVRAFAPVPKSDGRVLRVVYVLRPDGAHVVTAFLDRSRRRPK